MRILFLSRWYPYPPSNGSKLRIYNLLRGLADCHEVTLISFADEPDGELDLVGLQSLCRNIQIVPWKPFQPESSKALLGFFNPKPRSFIDTFSSKMKECIEQELSSNIYDAVIASQIDMAAYSPFFRQTPALFEEIEVGVHYEQFMQAASLRHRLRYGLTWLKHRHYLSSLLHNFQACTVVSEKERRTIAPIVNGSTITEVIPNCINLADYRGFQDPVQPNTLIFTGAFSYFPNYEAMKWFLANVFPLIQSQNRNVHLTITGNHGNRSLPPATNVTLTGFVDDVRPLIARSWVSIVPLHTGGGTRLKILEAMALGTPVVATSKGAEGLDAIADEHILIADTPNAFAKAVLRLLNESELRQRLSNNAYRLVQDKYDLAISMPNFLSLVEQVGST